MLASVGYGNIGTTASGTPELSRVYRALHNFMLARVTRFPYRTSATMAVGVGEWRMGNPFPGINLPRRRVAAPFVPGHLQGTQRTDRFRSVCHAHERAVSAILPCAWRTLQKPKGTRRTPRGLGQTRCLTNCARVANGCRRTTSRPCRRYCRYRSTPRPRSICPAFRRRPARNPRRCCG